MNNKQNQNDTTGQVPTTNDCHTLKDFVEHCEKTMRCNCDLDRWEPERDTWHSWVCRIHKRAKSLYEQSKR
jgi:hypothetical protein